MVIAQVDNLKNLKILKSLKMSLAFHRASIWKMKILILKSIKDNLMGL